MLVGGEIKEDHVFLGWSGGMGPGAYAGTSNPATVTMIGPISERVVCTVLPGERGVGQWVFATFFISLGGDRQRDNYPNWDLYSESNGL